MEINLEDMSKKRSINEYNEYIYDSNAFLFSLKSNGRINGMKKFRINSSKHAFQLFQKSSNGLFRFGSRDDIYVSQKDQGGSYCNKYSFNYGAMSRSLCGTNILLKQYFAPKHFIVIQMK